MKESTKRKVQELIKVLNFTFALFGVTMLMATLLTLHAGKQTISVTAITQAASYIGVAGLGVVICLTDAIFDRLSATIRIGIYSATVYAISLLYFRNTGIDPLSGPLRFLIYTTYFATIVTLILLLWSLYKRHIANEYNSLLTQYQQKP